MDLCNRKPPCSSVTPTSASSRIRNQDAAAQVQALKKPELHRLGGLNAGETGFMSVTEHIDATTPAGRTMLQMVGAFAVFEREMIRERTHAGPAVTREQGRVGGRKPRLSQQQAELIRGVKEERCSMAEAARLFRVHPATVTRLMAKEAGGDLFDQPFLHGGRRSALDFFGA